MAGELFEAAQVCNIKLMPDQGNVFIKQFLQARLMMKHIYQEQRPKWNAREEELEVFQSVCTHFLIY